MDFLQKAERVHGKGTFDYSEFEYRGCKVKGKIRCKKHGIFWQTPNAHTNNKSGCPKCAHDKNSSSQRRLAKNRRPEIHADVPEGSKAVPLTKGKYALVDEEDYERVMEYNWYYNCGYARNDVVGMMHRFIMNPPDDMEVDHKFHNRLDNRKSKLRVCTRQQNARNIRRKTMGSKYKGVYRQNESCSWFSMIKDSNELRYLGSYPTEIEAALAYDEAAKKYHGEFAYLNFPGEKVK